MFNSLSKSNIGNLLIQISFPGLDSLTGSAQNTLIDEEKVQSDSERGSHQGRKLGAGSKLAVRDYEQSLDAESTLEELSGHSVR